MGVYFAIPQRQPTSSASSRVRTSRIGAFSQFLHIAGFDFT
jgi:hypothetical protein